MHDLACVCGRGLHHIVNTKREIFFHFFFFMGLKREMFILSFFVFEAEHVIVHMICIC